MKIMKTLLLYALFTLKWVKLSIIITLAVPKPGGIPDSAKLNNVLRAALMEGCERFHDEVISSNDDDPNVLYVSLVSRRLDNHGINTFYSFIKNSTLYIEMPSECNWDFQESMTSLLDLAEEIFGCEKIVIFMRKNKKDLQVLIRSFVYIGFEVVNPTIYLKKDVDYFVLGYEL
ncbi:hypothetical protein BCR36DRAFT_323884 [Piromyces finnis]|uniref:Ornithine decarboxylase antizyme n=1 Tax=Piromyces finnis TaxID=1754191 RepID=A0A1Y1VDD3_9FUNG|nr:hypothetical protein BCR36DRAFT_323884 [Piromyces finnis]|eukprot:ORX52891.1 hypothetical protein BCR36DRAFT_323884 [Piromyces finnis]